MHERYKIAYITSWNPDDKQSWSGTLYSMKKALGQHGAVEWIDVRSKLLERLTVRCVWIYAFVVKLFTGKEYIWMTNLYLSRVRGYLIRKELEKAHYDFIFAPACANEIAFLETTIPIVYVSDATFIALNELYKTTINMQERVASDSHLAERKALEIGAIISLPSQWAVDSAIRDYQIPADKIYLNRFGSNFQNLPMREIKKLSSTCRIFFLGVDWLRKGGEIVVKSCDILIEKGLDIELTICGCDLPEEYHRDYITHIPFLDKNKEEDELRLIELFHNNHFFFMPSQGECYGMVYAEASSAGLPSIACDVGGVGSVVTSENGCLLPKSATPVDYAETIFDLFNQPDVYQQLSLSARKFYEEKLDWSIWASEIIAAYEELDSTNVDRKKLLKEHSNRTSKVTI